MMTSEHKYRDSYNKSARETAEEMLELAESLEAAGFDAEINSMVDKLCLRLAEKGKGHWLDWYRMFVEAMIGE